MDLLAVMEVVNDGLLLREIAEETDLDIVLALTAADIRIPQGEDIPRF
jgi:acyl CoA:acetate/3-ketoacid CoA transferase beta subunit